MSGLWQLMSASSGLDGTASFNKVAVLGHPGMVRQFFTLLFSMLLLKIQKVSLMKHVDVYVSGSLHDQIPPKRILLVCALSFSDSPKS